MNTWILVLTLVLGNYEFTSSEMLKIEGFSSYATCNEFYMNYPRPSNSRVKLSGVCGEVK